MAFPVNGVLDTFSGVGETTPPDASWTNGVVSFSGGDGLKIVGNQCGRAAEALKAYRDQRFGSWRA